MHTVRMSENDLKKQQLSGFYVDIDIKPGYDTETPVEKKERELEGIRRTGRNEDVFRLVECHVNLDLEGFEAKDESGRYDRN